MLVIRLFLFTFLFINVAFAIDAKIIFKKGSVEVQNIDGNSRDAKKGDLLAEGDRIITKENSFVIMRIEGHSVHRIEENSDIAIEKLPYYFEGTSDLEQGASVVMKVGTIFSNIVKKAEITTFTVRSKATEMGVRGTKLMASLDEGGDLLVSVKEGIVEIENYISKSRDMLLPNETMTIESDQVFTKAQKYDWPKKLDWDIENEKSNGSSLRSIRPEIKREFQQRKKPWVRNEISWKSKKEDWNKKEENYRQRVENFRPNKVKEERMKKLDSKINNLIERRGNSKEKNRIPHPMLDKRFVKPHDDFSRRRIDPKRDLNNVKRVQEIQKQRIQKRPNFLPPLVPPRRPQPKPDIGQPKPPINGGGTSGSIAPNSN